MIPARKAFSINDDALLALSVLNELHIPPHVEASSCFVQTTTAAELLFQFVYDKPDLLVHLIQCAGAEVAPSPSAALAMAMAFRFMKALMTTTS